MLVGRPETRSERVSQAVVAVAFMVFVRVASQQRVDGSSPSGTPRWVGIVVGVVTVIAALGALVQVARIGHSGAKASWSDIGGVGTAEK